MAGRVVGDRQVLVAALARGQRHLLDRVAARPRRSCGSAGRRGCPSSSISAAARAAVSARRLELAAVLAQLRLDVGSPSSSYTSRSLANVLVLDARRVVEHAVLGDVQPLRAPPARAAPRCARPEPVKCCSRLPQLRGLADPQVDPHARVRARPRPGRARRADTLSISSSPARLFASAVGRGRDRDQVDVLHAVGHAGAPSPPAARCPRARAALRQAARPAPRRARSACGSSSRGGPARPGGVRARSSAAQHARLELRPQPAHVAHALGYAPPRAAPAASRCRARACSSRARLAPIPGSRVIATSPGGNFARSFSAAGIVPVSHQREDLLLQRLADPGQLRRAPLARQRADRHRRFADRPARPCGRRARGARSRRRARTGRPVPPGRRRSRRSEVHCSGTRHADSPSAAAPTRTPTWRPHAPTHVHARMPGEPWLILPTYNEAENIERDRDAAGEVLAERRARGAFACSSSTTARPTAPARSPIGWPPSTTGCEVLHRTEKNGIGPAYLAGFRHALDHGAGYVMEMDSDFSHDPADLARLLAGRRAGADLALGSRYVPGGGVSDWGLLRRFISEGGSTYARIVLGLQRARPDRRLQVLPPRGARSDPLRQRPLAGLRLPGRAHLPRRAGRLSRGRGADRLPRPRARSEQDVLADRRRGDVARAAAALQAERGRPAPMSSGGWMPRPTPSRTACATRARPYARGSATRARSLAPLVRRLGARGLRAARRACWLVAELTTGYVQMLTLRPPFAVGDARDVLNVLGAATCSCSRCTRWPAWPASSPAARCRCRRPHHRGVSRWVHEHGGRIAIAFVVCATTFSLSSQAY